MTQSLPRQVVTYEMVIHSTIFRNIGGSSIERGGAIYKSGNFPITLLFCSFISCRSLSSAGAVYISGDTAYLSELCYYNCSTVSVVNNYYGNAIEGYCNSYLNFSYAAFSGLSPDSASDSTFYFYGGFSLSTDLNCTDCSGYGGSSGLFYEQKTSYSCIKNTNIIRGSAACAYVFVSVTNTLLDRINIISQESVWALWWVQTSTVTVSNSCCYYCTFTKLYDPSSPLFTDSYIDINSAIQGLSNTIIPTFQIQINNKHQCNLIKITKPSKISHPFKCVTVLTVAYCLL